MVYPSGQFNFNVNIRRGVTNECIYLSGKETHKDVTVTPLRIHKLSSGQDRCMQDKSAEVFPLIRYHLSCPDLTLKYIYLD